MLSAVSATRPNSRKIHSALLLQPAIPHLAFAGSIPGRKGVGGYHDILNRFDAPIFTTSSTHDFPLHKVFHLALCRKKDLGEHQIKMAGQTSTVPSRYAALGGYGPRASDEVMIPLLPPTSPYKLDDNIQIYGLDGSTDERIASHGDIINPRIAWALYTLIRHKMYW